MNTTDNSTDIVLTEDEFDNQYPLRRNHLNPNAGWGTDKDGDGCLFETYGEEIEFVRNQDPATVWTWVDSDDGPLLLSGLHYVNRIGYLVSTKPRPPNTWVIVLLDPYSDDDGPLAEQ
jgi:hypothetical protein